MSLYLNRNLQHMVIELLCIPTKSFLWQDLADPTLVSYSQGILLCLLESTIMRFCSSVDVRDLYIVTPNNLKLRTCVPSCAILKSGW